MPTPPAFDGFVEQSKRVSPTCLISFERTATVCRAAGLRGPIGGHGPFATLRQPPGQPAGLSRSARGCGRGQIVCEHSRVIQRSHKLPPRTIYDWRHDLAVLQRKPGALRSEPRGRHRFETRGERALRRTARGVPAPPAATS